MRNTTTRIARERKTRSRRGRKAVRSYPIAASRNDDRILKLRMDHGIEGYAVYHMLMEKIAESDRCEYAIDDYKVLAFDFRVDEQLVKCVAEDYHLFCFNDGRLSLNPSDMPADAGEEDSKEDVEEGGNDCDKGSGTKEAATKENAEASAANEDGCYVNTTSSHSKGSTPSAAGGKEARIESFLAYFSDYWNSVLTSTNSRLRPIRVVNGERRKRLVRLRQNYTDEEISRFVFRAANSPYLNARDGRLRQPADLNWMLSTDDRIVKIIEGNM